MAVVAVRSIEIERRRLTVIQDDGATVVKNCSYCVCCTELASIDEKDILFDCDKLSRRMIEKKQDGLDCNNGEKHVYRNIARDPSIIPYRIVTNDLDQACSNVIECHSCKKEYDELANGYPTGYCHLCGVLSESVHSRIL